MRTLKSHFTFTKKQRSGIFLLLLCIAILQAVVYFVHFSSEEIQIDNNLFLQFEHEMDSLKLVQQNKLKPKIYPFNPNYITDYKGYTLGMSTTEINRLLAFREKGQWVNSAKQFQEVTLVSDSLLQTIKPLFKFPKWVTQTKPNKQKSDASYTYQKAPKTFQQKTDLNTATAKKLEKVYGIGEKLAERIIKYRTKKNGFIADIELTEIYGLSPEVIQNILKEFTVKTPKPITKINLNQATKQTLVTIPYIDYEIAHAIIEYKILHEAFQSLEELKKVKDFPIKKFDIIKLYLTL